MASPLANFCYVRLLPIFLVQLENDRATLIYISAVSYEVCAPIMISFGFVSNTLGLATYIRMGLSDSVSISFFALALSDVCRSFPALLAWLGEILSTAGCVSPSLLDLRVLALNYSAMFLDISVFTIIYISVQRCACVAFPLQVRGVFTRFRVTCVIVFIYFLVFSWYIPLFAQQRLEEEVHPVTNVTALKIIYTRVWYTLWGVNSSVHIILSIIFQIETLVCLTVFTKALIASARFRLRGDALFREQGKLQMCVDNPVNNHFPIKPGNKTNHKPKDTNNSKTQTMGYSRKETQIIKVVALTSGIFVVGNIPTICLSITYLVIPGYRLHEHYLHLSVTHAVKNFCEYLNSDLNFFVYLTCNTKFKEAFYSTFNSWRCHSIPNGI